MAPPETKIASINPEASAVAERRHSIKRIVPVMVSPTKISLTEFVIETPGTRSIISPIIILSAFKNEKGLHKNDIPRPDINETMIIYVILFLHKGVNLYCIKQITRPKIAEIIESKTFPPKNIAKAPDARA